MTSARTRIATLTAVVAVLSGCACDTVPSDALESCEASQVSPGAVKTDILFVIDDSSSMSEEQAALRAALAEFITTLNNSPVKDDFQIGVTTTSVDTRGTAAGALVGAGIMPGTSPTLVPDFEATVMVGTAGSLWEQPFEAAKLAIEKSAPGSGWPNDGFIRPGARLAIFFLSDEDDCSNDVSPGPSSADCRSAKVAGTLYPISRYTDFLRAPINGEVKEVVVYAVAGFSQTTLALSCSGAWCTDKTCSTALDKGDRFLALAQAFGATGRIGSICSPTLNATLFEFAGAIMSQQMPLEGAPADPGLLVVKVTKAATGEVVSCGTVAMVGTPEAGTANVVYSPPQAGRPATLWFQHGCALAAGDRVNLDVICAG